MDTGFANASFEEILDDLCVRFIVNLPPEELESLPRICFQIEQAHWYYEDFVRPLSQQYPTLSLKKFSRNIFARCWMLNEWSGQHEEAFDEFMKYKQRVPVRGAIILNSKLNKFVLVRGFKSKTWGFPKGKIDRNEDDMDCAVREVYEEIGFDASPFISSDDYLEISIRDQQVKLYIIPDVPDDTIFETRTRNEIALIQWHAIKDVTSGKQNKYYLVAAFLPSLKKWIKQRRRKSGRSSEGDEDSSKDKDITAQNIVPARIKTRELLNILGINREQPLEAAKTGQAAPLVGDNLDLLSILRSGPSVPQPTQAQSEGTSDAEHRSAPQRSEGSSLLSILKFGQPETNVQTDEDQATKSVPPQAPTMPIMADHQKKESHDQNIDSATSRTPERPKSSRPQGKSKLKQKGPQNEKPPKKSLEAHSTDDVQKLRDGKKGITKLLKRDDIENKFDGMNSGPSSATDTRESTLLQSLQDQLSGLKMPDPRHEASPTNARAKLPESPSNTDSLLQLLRQSLDTR